MSADGQLFGDRKRTVSSFVSVDLFAGGGGASLGIERATGISPILAVNHNPAAILMHAANHMETIHACQSVWDVNPSEAVRWRAVDLLWASPDCTHFSRAKGGQPRSTGTRGLAWVVVDWAREVRPRIICLENVPEFLTWGPLDDDGQPVKARAGDTFREWVQALEGCGYVVEWRVLVACDYGTPTSRKRLYLVARRDGKPIVWPAPTHGKGLLPYHTAAECIDWSIPCPSIFERKKPLADATLRRIAEGVWRYVLNAAKPFIVCLSQGGKVEDVDQPMRTVTAQPKGGDRLLVQPFLDKLHGSALAGQPLDAPAPTVTAGGGRGGGHAALVSAFLANTRNGERVGQSPRVRSLLDPAPTTTATGSTGGLVAAFLAQHNGGAIGRDLREPHRTVAGNPNAALVSAFMCAYYGSDKDGADLTKPLRTATCGDRFGLVTVTIHGTEYVVDDIGMRMLQPRELARAQGFPDDYILTGTKGDQVARIGNSVCPPMAEAIVRANL